MGSDIQDLPRADGQVDWSGKLLRLGAGSNKDFSVGGGVARGCLERHWKWVNLACSLDGGARRCVKTI